MYDGRLLAVATSTPSRVRARGAVAIDVPRTMGRRILQLAPACTGPDPTTGPCTRTGAERARSVAMQGAEAAGLFAPCRGDIGVLR